MILDIPDKDKKKLGLIINYYRTNNYKDEHPTSWGINKFIRNKDENICSPTTLSNIENGNIIKSSDIYDELLEKLGQQYNYQKELSHIHKKFDKKIALAFESFNSELLDSLITEYIQALEPYKNFIIEKELISALKFSIDTHTVEIEKGINKYLKLFPIYEPSIKLILGDRLYNHIYNFGSLQKLEEVNQIVNLSSKSYRLQCNQIYTLIKKKYYLKAAELLSKLEKYYLKTDNTLGILQTYSLKLILMEECNSNEWVEETRKVLPTFKENIDKNKEQIITHIFNISMGCFNRKKYNLAFELLAFVLIESDELFLPTAIYLNNISTIAGLNIPQEANREEYPAENFPEEFNVIYKFYLLKNRGTPPKELENYIFENIRPIFINCSDDSLYQTFLIELEKCVSITGHKNLIYQYNRIKTRSIKS